MHNVPPFRYVRKTTLVLLTVFISFFVHRVIVSFSGDGTDGNAFDNSPVKQLNGVVCRNIVDGAPFGVDSVFPMHTRLHFYSELPKLSWDVPDRKILHIWYNGADTVGKVWCKVDGNSCESSLAPQLLSAGDWSVDAVDGRKLLSSRQFRVEPSRE